MGYACDCEIPGTCDCTGTDLCPTSGETTDVYACSLDEVESYSGCFCENPCSELDYSPPPLFSRVGPATGEEAAVELVITRVANREMFKATLSQGGRVLATELADIPAGAIVQGRIVTPAGRGAMLGLRQWGLNWTTIHRAGARFTWSLGSGLSWAFLAAVLVAYATPVIAREVLPITTGRLEDFRGECQRIADYATKIYVDHPYVRMDSCSACYNAAYFGTTRAPTSADITNCAAVMCNPGAAYQQMAREVGAANERAGTTCAAKPGGYYSHPFTRPILWADPPNVTDLSRVCPY